MSLAIRRNVETTAEDSVKNRNPKQLTIFVAPTLSKPAPGLRRCAEDVQPAVGANQLGVTMAALDNATKPERRRSGADVQLDTGTAI